MQSFEDKMTKKELRIVFMGTPDFAVESLRILVEGGYAVVGVVTMPDKPTGRHGSALQPSAVKQYALTQGLPVLQPEKLKDESFLEVLRSLQADLQVVVAFRMLPEVVWGMPRFGTFNLHASLLPLYRGAAPINWAIINGETETGVTTFFLTHGIDTGRIILQRKWPIAETDDAGRLNDALMTLGAGTVLETVDLLIEKDGDIETIPQEAFFSQVSANERALLEQAGDAVTAIAGCKKALLEQAGNLRPAPKIFNDTCRVDWRQPVAYLYNFIRGLSPYPAAWTELINPAGVSTTIKLFASEKIFQQHCLQPGDLRTDGKRYLDVAVADGFIRILSLQLAGKKRLSVKDFLNGTKIDDRWKMQPVIASLRSNPVANQGPGLLRSSQ